MSPKNLLYNFTKTGSSLTRDQKIALIAFAVLLGFGVYSFVKNYTLSAKVNSLSSQVTALEGTLASTTEVIGMLNKETLAGFERHSANLAVVEQKVGVYREQVGNFTSVVSNLEKLSKTDPQLLAKYSKVFFLNENYAPERLTEIPEAYRYSSTKAVSIHASVWPYLEKLMNEARRSGVTLYVSSGYRSFAEQKMLKGDYTITYGAGTANQFSADQGYSEHQLATTVDFLTTGIGGNLDKFGGTDAYKWLLANAHRYGFILSYPENNQHYVYEPWHWRFVGVKLATDLKSQGKGFYDMDQRDIDKYLVSIFE